MHVKMGQLAGLQIVPPALVGAVRLAFQTQGIPATAVSDSGEIDSQALIALAFDTIEIRTRLTPPIKINLRDLAPNPEVQRLLEQVQPAVTLSGRAGKFVYAPKGIPSGIASSEIRASGAQIGLGAGAAVLGLLILGAVLL